MSETRIDVVDLNNYRAARAAAAPESLEFKPTGRAEERHAYIRAEALSFTQRLNNYGLHDLGARRVREYIEGETIDGQGAQELETFLRVNVPQCETQLIAATKYLKDDNDRKHLTAAALSWGAAKSVLDIIAELRGKTDLPRNVDSYHNWLTILQELITPMPGAIQAKILELGANEGVYFRNIEPERYSYGASLVELGHLLTWRVGFSLKEVDECLDKIQRFNHKEFMRAITSPVVGLEADPDDAPEVQKTLALAFSRAVPMVDLERIGEFVQGLVD